MRVVDPIATTESNFESSTIQEPDTTTGEKEWVAIPFDGYDISSSVQSPGGVTKARGRSVYGVLDSTAQSIYWYNSSFSHVGTTSGADWGQYVRPIVAGAWGPPDSHGETGIAVLEEYQGSTTFWVLRAYNENGRFESMRWIGEPLSIFTPVAHSSYTSSGGKNIFVVLSDSGSGNYRVKGYDLKGLGTDVPVLMFDTPLVLNGRVPTGIDCRRGDFTILFKSGGNTSIAYYNSTFTTETTSHQITGNNPDGPYNAFTIDDSFGFKLMNTATKKIYNVDSNYNHGSVYKVGDEVIKAAIHKKYRCLVDTTTDPEVGVGEVPPKWLELGATNRWAMFDGINTYQSNYAGDVDIRIRPLGVVDSISIFNIENVTSIEITTSVPDTGSTYTEIHDTTGKESLVTYDFPPYENPFVDIKFVGTDIKVGEVVMGTGTVLGVLLAGAVSDRIDYSRYTYDEFGELTYVPRPIVNYTTYPIRVAKIDALGVERYLDNLKGKQAVWIGNIGDGQHLVTRGTIERSPMTYDTPSVLEYQIKVRGSI